MRYFIALLIIISFSCSDDQSPKYSSIEGSWEFFSATTEGNFVIIKTNNELFVESGAFSFSSHSFTINSKSKITTDYISLLGTENSQLTLLDPVIKSDYTEINVFKIEYDSKTIPTTTKSESVLLRRKN
jgi:hypothetical protein